MIEEHKQGISVIEQLLKHDNISKPNAVHQARLYLTGLNGLPEGAIDKDLIVKINVYVQAFINKLLIEIKEESNV